MSSGERKRTEPKPAGLPAGVAGPGHGKGGASRGRWKAAPQRVKAPSAKRAPLPTVTPSRAGHVKPRLNPEGPPSKAEH